MSKIDLNSLPVVKESLCSLQISSFLKDFLVGRIRRSVLFNKHGTNHIIGYSTIPPKMCASVTLVSKHWRKPKFNQRVGIHVEKVFTIGKMLKSHSETTKIVRYIGNLLKCYIPCQERPRISDKLCPKATPMRRKRTGNICWKFCRMFVS